MKETFLGVVASPQVFAGLVRVKAESMFTAHMNQVMYLKVGDNHELIWYIKDDQDPPVTVDITDLVIRFAARQRSTIVDAGTYPNELVFKTSLIAGEITIVGSDGKVTVLVLPEDTKELQWQEVIWELEMVERVGAAAPGTGTVEVTEGSGLAEGTGTNFLSEVDPGDILTIAGSEVSVRQVVSDTQLYVDIWRWASSSLEAFQVTEGKVTTVSGGVCKILAEAVI